MSSDLSKQVRAVLEEAKEAISNDDLLLLVDRFVIDCSSSSEPQVILFQLEDQLQAIYRDAIDHSSPDKTGIFLAVLYHLSIILSSTSIISTWFDLVLRPALREPKLSTISVNYAKDLVISALRQTDENFPEKNQEFRQRLFDLYLLDAFNEGSGADFLEWAQLDQEQKHTRTFWKSNLEDILLKYGIERPTELMTEIQNHFSTPSNRLQLLMFMNLLTSEPSFSHSAAILASHPLMSSFLSSLLLDTSSTCCSIGLTLLGKFLPIFAVQACGELKRMLSELLAILAKMLCWQERPRELDSPQRNNLDDLDASQPPDSEGDLKLRSNLEWRRLGLLFNAISSPPDPRRLFTILYYLFPCNVIRFLRTPLLHLAEHHLRSPFTVPWEQVLDEDKIRSRSESLLRGHVCHPLIIWRDAATELSQPDFWAGYDIARITSESLMLDVQNATLGIREQNVDSQLNSIHSAGVDKHLTGEKGRASTTMGRVNSGYVSSGSSPKALPNILSTSSVLKSDLDVGTSKSTPPPFIQSNMSNREVSHSAGIVHDVPSHVAEAISSLQRELLLLRNELSFELWLSGENVKHIGRLYQDHALSRNAEAERQGLYNKLRKYRSQVNSLERELKEHKEQASSAKNKFADWNAELLKKLNEFRREKQLWITEAAVLRAAEKEAKAHFVAQGTLLANATKEVFELQTQRKEVQPKIDRLMDYERQLEQQFKMQRVWDEDFRKFKERAEELELKKAQQKQMQLILESYEKIQCEVEEAARGYRRRIQELQAQLTQANKPKGSAWQMTAAKISAFTAEKSTLSEANKKLREENADLRDEVEEMKAMLEMLKSEVNGRKGLVSSPRASPTLRSQPL